MPLVALGTQTGSIDIVDVYANAVANSFSVHVSIIRGLRWLGNTRLVSFSSVQVCQALCGSFVFNSQTCPQIIIVSSMPNIKEIWHLVPPFFNKVLF